MSFFGVIARYESDGKYSDDITGSISDSNITFTATFSDKEFFFSYNWSSEEDGLSCDWSTSVQEYGMNDNATTWDRILSRLQQTDFYSRHEVWVYQYNWMRHIRDNGQDLLNRVNTKGIRNPILISYSMGGLVARAYVALGGEFSKLVTLGTPNTGTPLANLANVTGISWFDVTGVQDLRPGSDFMHWINSADSSIRYKYVTFAGRMDGYWDICGGIIPYVCWKWYEDYPDWLKPVWWLLKASSGNNDGLVPESSALLDGTDKKDVQKYRDHMDLVNPNKAINVFNYIAGL
jgi:pimeloyl-ACP methyl ester carboxylesterase